MTIRLLCPNNHELICDDAHVGRKVRCPACKVVMVVPDPNAGQGVTAQPPRKARQPPPVSEQPLDELPEVSDEAPPDDEEYRPRKPKKMKNAQRMARANLGLGFHYFRVLCFLVAILLNLVGNIVARFAFAGAMASAGAGDMGTAQGAAGFAGVVILITGCGFGLFMLVTPILGFVGSLLCLWVPQKTRGKALIMVSFGLDSGAIGALALSFFVSMAAGASAAAGNFGGATGGFGLAFILVLLSLLLILAAWILFMLFLRALARYLDDESTADEVMRILIMTIVIGVAGPILMFFVAFLLVRVSVGLAGFVMLGMAVAWLIALIKFLLSVLNLIATIRAQIARRY